MTDQDLESQIAPAARWETQDARLRFTAKEHIAVVAVAFALWGWSVALVDERAMGDMGLVTILPIATFVALLLALAGFVVAVWQDRSGPVLGTYVMSLAVMLHGLPTFAYDHLRFSWAWKHVGMVDYIQRYGDVDTAAGSLSVYHNWPGFFGLNAWITDNGGMDSALSYAAWAPILFNLLFIGALYMLFRAFTTDQRLIWTSILIFSLGSWVGQDYFSPQAVAFFMYLLLLAILLRWYRRPEIDDTDVGEYKLDSGSAAIYIVPGVLVLAMTAIISTHQLTPVITVAAVGGLVIFRQVRVRWPLLVVIGVVLVWFFGPARNFVVGVTDKLINEFGGVQSNLGSTVVDLDQVSAAQRGVSLVSRLLSASIIGLAAIGLLRRRALGLRSGWAIVLAAVPALMIVVSSYGGEILLRSYLFTLPFAAYLAASWFFPTKESSRHAIHSVALGATLVVLTAGLLIADFGADQRQVFSNDEVAAADYVVTSAGPGSLIIEATRDYPRLHKNNEQYTYLTLDRLSTEALDRVIAGPADLFAEWLRDTERYSGGYVIITESQYQSVSVLGEQLIPMITTVEQSLKSSDLFEIGYEGEDAVVFQLAEQS